MVILVEKWLNDDDFQLAEERGDIFSPDKEEEQDNGDVDVCLAAFTNNSTCLMVV